MKLFPFLLLLLASLLLGCSSSNGWIVDESQAERETTWMESRREGAFEPFEQVGATVRGRFFLKIEQEEHLRVLQPQRSIESYIQNGEEISPFQAKARKILSLGGLLQGEEGFFAWGASSEPYTYKDLEPIVLEDNKTKKRRHIESAYPDATVWYRFVFSNKETYPARGGLKLKSDASGEFAIDFRKEELGELLEKVSEEYHQGHRFLKLEFSVRLRDGASKFAECDLDLLILLMGAKKL